MVLPWTTKPICYSVQLNPDQINIFAMSLVILIRKGLFDMYDEYTRRMVRLKVVVLPWITSPVGYSVHLKHG